MGRTGQTPGNGRTGLDSAPAGAALPTLAAIATTGNGADLAGWVPASKGGTGAGNLSDAESAFSKYQTLEACMFDVARQRLGATDPFSLHGRFWDMDFGTVGALPVGGNQTGWAWNGHAVQSATLPGGVVSVDTTTTASTLLAAYGSAFCAARPDSGSGHFAVRCRFPTAIDAQTFLGWALCKAINDHSIFLGVAGNRDLSHFVLVYDASGYPNSGTGTAVAIAPLDTNWHTFEIWYAGGILRVAVDGVDTGIAVVQSAAPTVPVFPAMTGYNGSTAASRTMDTDWLSIATWRL